MPETASRPDGPVIRLAGVHKSFGDKRVLRGVDLEVEEGQSAVVIGGSGTGKSVLLKHVIGLLKPDAGRVEVDGTAIHAPTPPGPPSIHQVRHSPEFTLQTPSRPATWPAKFGSLSLSWRSEPISEAWSKSRTAWKQAMSPLQASGAL